MAVAQRQPAIPTHTHARALSTDTHHARTGRRRRRRAPLSLSPPRAQLLFLSGMALTIGVQSTVQFFSRRRNRKV
jgi:hypothetical protein